MKPFTLTRKSYAALMTLHFVVLFVSLYLVRKRLPLGDYLFVLNLVFGVVVRLARGN